MNALTPYAFKREPQPHQVEASHSIIYGVCDPRVGTLRYVGKTKHRLEARVYAHLRSKAKTHRAYWFRSLAKAGITPDAFVLEVVKDGECWKEAERFWIAYFKMLGSDLVNTSTGGDGATGVKDPPHVRAKKSAGMKGKAKSAEHRRNIGLARLGRAPPNKGVPHSAETRKLISDTQRGKPKGPQSEAHRKALSVVKKGKGIDWFAKARACRTPECMRWTDERKAKQKAVMAIKYASGWSPIKKGTKASQASKDKLKALYATGWHPRWYPKERGS